MKRQAYTTQELKQTDIAADNVKHAMLVKYAEEFKTIFVMADPSLISQPGIQKNRCFFTPRQFTITIGDRFRSRQGHVDTL
ncbi:hypothetical protein KSF78_0009239 [Schistosoma japonicum]|nr:hypothetical protein KSF78_0009239 [Schistosoma japonicum]